MSLLVKERGLLFEDDPTRVYAKHLALYDFSFQKVYNLLYNVELDVSNFNILLNNPQTHAPFYVRPFSVRHNYTLNEMVPLKWTIFTCTKIIEVPLILFVLVSCKVRDVQRVITLVLETVRHFSIIDHPELRVFVREVDFYVRQILSLRRQVPSAPIEVFHYLFGIKGNI